MAEQQNGSKEESNISEVVDDCLEKIFGYLDFINMVNVGISSPRFRNAVKGAIHRKYGSIDRKTIVHSEQGNARYYVDERNITIKSIHNLLPFLRSFGDSILKLSIRKMSYTNDNWERISEYIHQYCNNFEELEICASKNVLVNVQRPMKNVSNLSIYMCDLGQQFLQFPRLFPELRRAEIIWSSRFDYFHGFSANFPRLEHLRIGMDNRDRSIGFSPSNVKMILQ